jgi:hypothetical protein
MTNKNALNSMMQRSFFLLLLLSQQPIQAQPVFDHQVIDAGISIGYGLAIGDVDGDKKPDILLADKKQFMWYRNGDWKKFILAENLTASDNVCIAARDIDGDGKVEIAVGAQWNPGETSDTLKSGSVHYLVRPSDPTQAWTAIQLHHEPTVHRMKWVKIGPDDFRLVVVPLHGRGNANGAGTSVKVLAYQRPRNPNDKWTYQTVDQSMHLTHNFDLLPDGNGELIGIGGKEGLKLFNYRNQKWQLTEWRINQFSLGELRFGKKASGLVVAIEPMHGNKVTAYKDGSRTVLDSTYNQGHALAVADLSGNGSDQVVAGWREKDLNGKTGIKIFGNESGTWRGSWLDEGIACEDLVVADLNGDSKPDIIAAGRATKNLKVYWNKSK